jgi:hypothetical protein
VGWPFIVRTKHGFKIEYEPPRDVYVYERVPNTRLFERAFEFLSLHECLLCRVALSESFLSYQLPASNGIRICALASAKHSVAVLLLKDGICGRLCITDTDSLRAFIPEFNFFSHE